MIAQLAGRLVRLREDRVVVDCGGVGYLVIVAPATLARLPEVGERVTLSTWLAVREDALTLYGFADETERELFELLMTVTGVGPKLAQGSVAALPPGQLVEAIATGDERRLISLPGVGKRLAQRLIVELADKIGQGAWSVAAEGGGDQVVASEVIEALTGLGFTAAEARRAARAAVVRLGEGAELGAVIREALRQTGER